MSIRRIIDQAISNAATGVTGTIASEFYEYYDAEGNYSWAVDVDIGQDMIATDEDGNEITTTVLTAVPVATNNRDILYAQVGFPVYLTREGFSKWTVTGLAKSLYGETSIIYVNMTSDFGAVARRESVGYYYRLLRYDEFVDAGGYGVIRYGAVGKFRASDDALIRVL